MGDIINHSFFDHHPNKHQNSVKNNHNNNNDGFRGPTPSPPLRESLPLNYNTRQRQQSNWQRSHKGEVDRMQAFFLISPGRTKSGTGVFLPATAFQPIKKPACSPVLLPARVVQALNLNVHNNGIHISPRSELRENDSKKKNEMVDTKDETPIDSSESLLKKSSSEFLPEEWTY